MANQPTPPRLYGDKEVGKILKRATELQRDVPAGSAVGRGLSLQELEEIALEAGIDPGYLRRAALELETGELGPTGWSRLVGDHLTLVREVVIPGELPESGFERVVGVIQSTAREHGQPSLLGRTLTWQAETANKTRTMQLVVSVRSGETRVRVEERLHQLAGGLFGGTVGGAGVGIGLGVGLPVSQTIGSVLFGALFPVGAVALCYIAARGIYRAVVDARRRAVDEIMEQVTAEIRDCLEEASAVPETPTLPPSS